MKGSFQRAAALAALIAMGCSGAPVAPRAPDAVVERPPLEDAPTGDPVTFEPEDRHDVPKVTPGVLRVAVVSDLNSSYGSTTYRTEVHDAARWIAEELRPDLVLSTGDHVAGMKRGVDLDGMWAGFHDAFTLALDDADIPFAPTPGNHDASAYDAFAQERERYRDEWSARRPDVAMLPGSAYPFHYAFEREGALFVSLDVTVARALDSEQLAWLERTLESWEGEGAKIVFGHVPLRAFAGGKKRDEVVRDPALEAALERGGVDAYLSGHHHAYFPGRVGRMRMVAMPCLGSGARALDGRRERSARGVVVLELGPDGVLAVESHTASSGFESVVDRALLPESVGEGERVVWRDDVRDPLALVPSH